MIVEESIDEALLWRQTFLLSLVASVT